MYTLKVENQIGDVLTLTQNENDFQIQKIEGLSPANGTINTSLIVGMDGALFNSAKLEVKEIVLYIKINGNAERNRNNLYKYFTVKKKCKLYYKNGLKNVFIEGFVSSFECDLFAEGQIAQISILCPYPYFKAIAETVNDISNVIGLFTFPFSIDFDEPIPISDQTENRETMIYNPTQTDIGLVIKAQFGGDVEKLEVRNTLTGEKIIVRYNFQNLDILTINTNQGQKSISLLRNGVQTNIFSAVDGDSAFFALHAGINMFGFAADDGVSDDDVKIQIIMRMEYEGV